MSVISPSPCTQSDLYPPTPTLFQTAMFQGKVVDQCIVCPAHNTAFDLKTGAVKVSGDSSHQTT